MISGRVSFAEFAEFNLEINFRFTLGYVSHKNWYNIV